MAGNQTAGTTVVTNTLTANNADLVYLTQPGFSVKVTNLTGTAPIWFTVSQQGGTCPVPTVGGEGTYCAASVAGTAVNVRTATPLTGPVVQLISSGTPSYAVEVQSARATS